MHLSIMPLLDAPKVLPEHGPVVRALLALPVAGTALICRCTWIAILFCRPITPVLPDMTLQEMAAARKVALEHALLAQIMTPSINAVRP